MEFLQNFERINKNDTALAGGKGASLGDWIEVNANEGLVKIIK
jgi:phosphoenolpyruvate synthase/pyruvate phosphate dikinase